MLYIFLTVVAKLPLAWLYMLANCLSVLLYLLPSSFKNITRTNLQLVYPELSKDEQKSLLRRSLTNQLYTYVESVKCWGMPKDYSLSLIHTVEGEELLKQALKDDKGVILVLTHFGCWELLNAWVNEYTEPMIMYKPNKNKAVDRFIFKARQNFKANLVATDKTGVAAIFKHLKQGGLTMILPDHLPKPSGGIYAQFFGQEILCTTLVSKLAQKTQSHVLGLSCIRQKDGFKIVCQKMHSDIAGADLYRSVTVLNQNMEQMINQAPEQYIWSYKRFRHMPNHPYLYKSM
ncbi:lysophospholipid acyltransferase family protein [uncultured Acinetobacter sp.]|uniref:lysophospholipid acyltransferase family protein n=1 Tax=uncultured Acinetobacter sp. TaxID=165433 RepID=UPI0026292BF4|nr:lysophospholipid acyltransferase family protein [uncultured Acinetobacter sp.]